MSISNINISLLSLLILFSSLIEGGTTYLPVTIIRVITLILFSFFLYGLFEKGSLRLRRTNFDFLIFLFFLISITSIFLSSYKNITIQWVISILNYILIFYLTLNIVRGKDDERVIIGALLAILIFQSIYGICQYLILGLGRASGTFFNPNFYGTYLAGIMLLILSVLLPSRVEKDFFTLSHISFTIPNENRLEKIFFSKFSLWFFFILAFIAVIFSKSRGAILSFLAGLILILSLLYKLNRRGIFILVAVILLLLLIPNPLKTRIVNLPGSDIYAFSRFPIWKSSISVISENPFGIGLGMYKYYYPKYNFPVKEALAYYGKKADTAHCEYLQILAELGIGGIIIFFLGLFFFYRKGFNIIKGSEPVFEKGLNTGLMGGITGFLFQAFFDSTFHEPAIVILIVVFSGLFMRKLNLFFGEIKFLSKRKLLFLSFTVLLAVLGIIFVSRFYFGYYFFVKGKDSLKNRNYIEAERSLKKAIFFNPADPSYWDFKANLLYNKYLESPNPEFLKEASNQLYVATSLNPKNAYYYDHLGFIYSALAASTKGKTRNSTSYLENSLKSYFYAKELQPYNAYYRNSIGRIYLSSHQIEKAEKEFKNLLTIEPNFLPARVSLLKIYEKLNKNNLAKKEIEDILNIYEKYKNFSFSGAYEKDFLKINIAEINKKAKGLMTNIKIQMTKN